MGLTRDGMDIVKAWLPPVLCAAALLATVPAARTIQRAIYASLGKEFFTYFVIAAITASAASVLYILVSRTGLGAPSRYIWLALSAGALVYMTIGLDSNPEESVHFLEYGLLTLLIYRALSKTVKDRSIFITVVLMATLIGVIDEFIQWLLPSRVWDYRDIGLNFIASAIFSFSFYKVFRPDPMESPIKRRSMRILLVFFTIDALAISLCLSNTPERVLWYSERIGFLSRLAYEEPMTKSVIKTGLVDITSAGLILGIFVLLALAWIGYLSSFHLHGKKR